MTPLNLNLTTTSFILLDTSCVKCLVYVAKFLARYYNTIYSNGYVKLATYLLKQLIDPLSLAGLAIVLFEELLKMAERTAELVRDVRAFDEKKLGVRCIT